MDRRTIRLTAAERQFLAFSLPAEVLWPADEAQASALLREVPGGAVAGGPRLRALLLATAHDQAPELAVELSASELWLIDSVLLRHDLRGAKLPDGEPLLSMAMKVWRLILELYNDVLPTHLRQEVPDADNDHAHEDADDSTDLDARDAVAGAEALLRSRDREGTADDLPPAAA